MDGVRLSHEPIKDGIRLIQIDESLRIEILRKNPEYDDTAYIKYDDLVKIQLEYLEELINSDSEYINNLNKNVLRSVEENEPISKLSGSDKLTIGQKTADMIAKFGGSWPFIFIFIMIISVWITVNSIGLVTDVFDPYPYILLNLALSCLAAIQAPIIMMSQNREADRDRVQASNDYETNLRSEIEIRLLHQKLNYLMEVQKMQIDLLDKIQNSSENE